MICWPVQGGGLRFGCHWDLAAEDIAATLSYLSGTNASALLSCYILITIKKLLVYWCILMKPELNGYQTHSKQLICLTSVQFNLHFLSYLLRAVPVPLTPKPNRRTLLFSEIRIIWTFFSNSRGQQDKATSCRKMITKNSNRLAILNH